LREGVADRGGSGVGKSSGDPGGTQGPGGVLRDARKGLGEFQCL
jgi:hypothetical protein